MSCQLKELRNFIPSDFARKPRSLIEYNKWKATELRQWLLYSGPVILRTAFPDQEKDNMLHHFVMLHVAVQILINKRLLNDYKSYSRELLLLFVKKMILLYGRQMVPHNVHNLIHLVDDVEIYGVLDNFSAFPFESSMQPLKKLIRKGDEPLSQVVKRMSERDGILLKGDCWPKQDGCEAEHENGPLLQNCTSPQYSVIRLKSFTLSTTRKKDSCCLMEDSTIVRIVNICCIENPIATKQLVIIGQEFVGLTDLYEVPCRSSVLGIYKAKSISKKLSHWSINSISKKMVCLPIENDEYALFPLLHCDS